MDYCIQDKKNKTYSIYNWGFDFGTNEILMLLGVKLISLSLYKNSPNLEIGAILFDLIITYLLYFASKASEALFTLFAASSKALLISSNNLVSVAGSSTLFLRISINLG